MTLWERIKLWFMMNILLIKQEQEEYEENYSELERVRKENGLS
jgi:hypothetical protein